MQNFKRNSLKTNNSTANFQSIASTATRVADGSIVISKFISQKLCILQYY